MALGTAQTDVANKALIEMGETGTLTALSDDNDAARCLSATLNISRRAVLRSHYWGFAKKRVQIAKDSSNPDFDKSSRYRLPGDFITLVEMYPRENDWRLEGSYLLSNSGPPLDLIYVRDEDNLGVWDALALDALATRLAADCAYAITGDRNLRAELGRLYKDKLADARHMAAMENQNGRELDIDVWEASRGG